MAPVKSKGGRPAKQDVEKLDAKIIAVATRLFLKDGYGATSIEAIAKAAGASKRTLYHRYQDKSELFSAVMHQLITGLHPPNSNNLFSGGSLKEILTRLASAILQAALSREGLSLHRLLISEAERFPILAKIMTSEGSRSKAISGISAILKNEMQKGNIKLGNTDFAAEQFLQMLISTPQNRALGLGEAMSENELKEWSENTVEFFLNSCRL